MGERETEIGIPKVLLNNTIRILILECEHATAGVLDQHNLSGTEELLADDDGAEGVDGRCAGLRLLLDIHDISRLHHLPHGMKSNHSRTPDKQDVRYE